jgi:hypothetical protein
MFLRLMEALSLGFELTVSYFFKLFFVGSCCLLHLKYEVFEAEIPFSDS